MSEEIQKRPRGNPKWKKGVSGNISGRPAGTAGIAALIRERTHDYVVLIDSLLRIAGNPKRGADQIASIKLLLAYGLGQPQQRVEHSGTLTLEELIADAGARAMPLLPAPPADDRHNETN